VTPLAFSRIIICLFWGEFLVGVFVLAIVYWLSDLAIAFWIGGLVAATMLFGMPLGPADLEVESLIHVAMVPMAFLDQYRPFFIGAGVILLASTAVSYIVERPLRTTVRWWVSWIVRSASVVALVSVSLYGAGEMSSHVNQIESLSGINYSDISFPDDENSLAPDTVASGGSLRRKLVADTSLVFTDARLTFVYWAKIEGALVCLILLVGAYREASWRNKSRSVSPAPLPEAVVEVDSGSTSETDITEVAQDNDEDPAPKGIDA
jgi:hypothetical protein